MSRLHRQRVPNPKGMESTTDENEGTTSEEDPNFNVKEQNSPNYGVGAYEDPKTFEPYQLFFLLMDCIFNWTVDWAHTDPLAILVIFVFQCLGLIVNLIVYIMASASQAMQSGLRKSVIHHHQANLIACVVYLMLTCSWYIWALKKSWPSVSDQFSFSFGGSTDGDLIDPTINTPIVNTTNSTMNATITTTTTFTTTATLATTTGLPPLLQGGMNQSLLANRGGRSRSFRRLFQLPSHRGIDHSSSGTNRGLDDDDNGTIMMDKGPFGGRDFYTLWSPGFVALYVTQRTVAILFYCICLKSTYLVLNTANTIINADSSSPKYPATGTIKNPGSKSGDFLQQSNPPRYSQGVGNPGLDLHEEGHTQHRRRHPELKDSSDKNVRAFVHDKKGEGGGGNRFGDNLKILWEKKSQGSTPQARESHRKEEDGDGLGKMSQKLSEEQPRRDYHSRDGDDYTTSTTETDSTAMPNSKGRFKRGRKSSGGVVVET